MWVWSLVGKSPWRRKEEMATPSSILAWETPRTEEPLGPYHGVTNSWTWLSMHAVSLFLLTSDFSRIQIVELMRMVNAHPVLTLMLRCHMSLFLDPKSSEPRSLWSNPLRKKSEVPGPKTAFCHFSLCVSVGKSLNHLELLFPHLHSGDDINVHR